MNNNLFLVNNEDRPRKNFKKFLVKLHLDIWFLSGIFVLAAMGLLILYSASNQNSSLFLHQLTSLALSCAAMFLFAQISPHRYQSFAPWLYLTVLLMLFAVIGIGIIGKGAQRWLGFGIIRFQPSEIMKLAMPLMLAWYLRDKPLPLGIKDLFCSCGIILLPALLIAKQPDLSTTLLILIMGGFVLLLAGITWKIFISAMLFIATIIPIAWRFMHPYQRERLFSFLSPENDPHGSGYNIIQSKIAIGSGGWLGKGWLLGPQTHLQFLPEHTTDFIFAVCGEEFGFIGCIFLLFIFLYIVGYGLYISINAQDTFSRLLSGSLVLFFFASFFINVSMVTGIIPVAGVPLPLVSFGGTSLLTFMSIFGIIMSVHTHKKVISS